MFLTVSFTHQQKTQFHMMELLKLIIPSVHETSPPQKRFKKKKKKTSNEATQCQELKQNYPLRQGSEEKSK